MEVENRPVVLPGDAAGAFWSGFVATGSPTAESMGTSAELSENAQHSVRSIPSRLAYSRIERAFSVSAQQSAQHAPGSDMVLELEPVTDDFVDAEMQRDGVES